MVKEAFQLWKDGTCVQLGRRKYGTTGMYCAAPERNKTQLLMGDEWQVGTCSSVLKKDTVGGAQLVTNNIILGLNTTQKYFFVHILGRKWTMTRIMVYI